LQQLLIQAEAVGAAALWSCLATILITALVSAVIGLRVSQEHETQGLDFASHGETGYHINR
jgi:Amt family ammonium transporter